MVRYVEYGDIFKINGVKNYAHGCNCVGAMGKGIAVQFKERFPAMYKKYKKLCVEGNFQLGDVFDYFYGDGFVYNLGTQKSWKDKADLAAIEQSLTRMLALATANGVEKIALPKIGAGLGGLSWADVKNVIDNIGKSNNSVELLVIENYRNHID